MAKYLDKTPDEWENLVEQWHDDESLTMSLPEFLELDETEYLRLVHSIDTPNLTPNEVLEESRKNCSSRCRINHSRIIKEVIKCK